MIPLALVVENDGGTQKLLRVLLAREGFDVDAVSSGQGASVLLRRVSYDVVVLDLMLPEVSGFELLEQVAQTDRSTLERVIVASSAARAQLDAVRRLYPEVAVIRKPFDIDDISAAAVARRREPIAPLTLDDVFCRTSVIAGAKGGLIARLSDDGSYLHHVTSFGYTPQLLEKYYPLPIDSPYPLCAAARTARAVWFSSINSASADYPMLANTLRENRSLALAAVPVTAGDRVVGVAAWSFPEPHPFDAAEQTGFVAIAAAFADDLQQGGITAAS